MPLYIADYLADTGHLNASEHGAYLMLIMHYWRTGSLPSEDRFLARIARMTDREWAKARPTIAAFFGDGWTHKRIDEELEKASRKSEARAECGSLGGHAKALKTKETALAKATDLLQQKNDFALASSSESQPQPESEKKERKSATHSCRKQVSASVSDARRFYEAYPKHVDPRAAEVKFMSIVKSGVDPEYIIAAAARYAEAHRMAGTDKQMIPAPAVWLNKGGYDSEDLPRARPPPKSRSILAICLESMAENDEASPPTNMKLIGNSNG